MGLVVDTSVLINAERRGLDVSQMLKALPGTDQEHVVIASITLMELAHGISRSRTERTRLHHQAFADELRKSVLVIELSGEIALRAGYLDGTLRASGHIIGIADAVIAATALEFGYSVVTLNVKNFEVVTGLKVVAL